MAYDNAADLVELNDLGDWDVNLGKLDSEATTAQSVKVASATEATSVNSKLRPNIFDARCELDASCQTTEPISAAPHAIALVS